MNAHHAEQILPNVFVASLEDLVAAFRRGALRDRKPKWQKLDVRAAGS
jgi:hypothetical protein